MDAAPDRGWTRTADERGTRHPAAPGTRHPPTGRVPRERPTSPLYFTVKLTVTFLPVCRPATVTV
jgi:hypothetical protein